MTTKDEATEIARRIVRELGAASGEEFVLVTNRTIQREACYVFFYNSRRFIETGEGRYRLAGNGPIVVSRQDGSAKAYGTLETTESSVAEFEREMGVVKQE
jgi:Immunity protein 35